MCSQSLRIVLIGLASLALSACGGGGGGGTRRLLRRPQSRSCRETGQSGTVGTELPAALTVRVTDSGAQPVSGVTVSWAVTTGGGTVTPASGTTDGSGTTSARWLLGPAPGATRSTARIPGITSVVIFDATATAAVTASVTVSSPTLSPYEGDTVQLTAVAKDASGNVLPGKTATWSSSRPQLRPCRPAGLLQTLGHRPRGRHRERRRH